MHEDAGRFLERFAFLLQAAKRRWPGLLTPLHILLVIAAGQDTIDERLLGRLLVVRSARRTRDFELLSNFESSETDGVGAGCGSE